MNIFPVLIYHELYHSIEEKKYCNQKMGPTCALHKSLFNQQLDLIKENYINTISFDNLASEIRNDNKKYIILSFDDGHSGNYFYAYPLLKKRNMVAVFFVATDLIGTNNKMMTWRHLKEMANHGMSIQSHGISHIPFENLSTSLLKEELSRSKKKIEDTTGAEVNAISLPHGSIHPHVYEEALNTGYKFICTSQIGYFEFNNMQDINFVPRISISEKNSLQEFSNIILNKSSKIFIQQIIQKAKYAMRNVIGINNYRRLYRLIYRIQK